MQDPRGNLTLTYLGLADKLKPKWIVYENVPGLLSSNGGRDFGSFLGALVELGYGFAYRVLDAQYFGVPQRRRRVFVVACLGDWRAAAEVLSLREGLRGYLETGNKKRKGVAADAGAGSEASGLPIWRAGDQANAEHMIDHAGTVNCNKGSHGGFIAQPVSHWEGGEVHPTLNQSAKGSGGVGSSNQELFSQGGAYLVPGQPIPIQDGREIEKHQNGMGVGNAGDPAYTIDTTGAQAAGIPFRKSKRACSTTDNETWVPADASNTLNNFDLGDTRTTHAVVQHQMPGSVAPTIGASGPPYSRTGNERVEAEALAVTVNIYGGNKRKDRPEGGMYVREEDTTKCLDAANGLNPTCSQGGTAVIAPCITASNDPSRSPQSSEVTQQIAAVHQATMAVRRLTPVECERLQGFPDNWSRISWKGKPETECPDGPRYKACGNSMAVPVMRWIGERIAEVDATLSTHA
jgi:DNA (cytosine-5)-methyltransferase 1